MMRRRERLPKRCQAPALHRLRQSDAMRITPKAATLLTAAKLLTVLSAAMLFLGASTLNLPGFGVRLIGVVSGQEAGQTGSPQKTINPAAWGGHHVGKPIPEFV